MNQTGAGHDEASVLEAELRTAIGQLGGNEPGRTVAVAVERLSDGMSALVNGSAVFHPASTIKVALLAAVYDAIARGKLSGSARVTVHNGFPSSIDGSLFDLDAEDDSEKSLYGRMGEAVEVRELARLMIVRSSNLATNLLLEVVPPGEVMAFLDRVGLGESGGLLLRNRMMDLKAFELGLTNRGTAAGLCRPMAMIGRGELAGSAEMLGVLEAQELNEGLPAGLPPGSRCAHKTGSITGHYHDVGVVDGAWAIAVLTRGYADEKEAQRLVATLGGLAARWMRGASGVGGRAS
ncbi:MAG: serine hydrolase [Tepidisphaerales bacterium]